MGKYANRTTHLGVFILRYFSAYLFFFVAGRTIQQQKKTSSSKFLYVCFRSVAIVAGVVVVLAYKRTPGLANPGNQKRDRVCIAISDGR